jgi:hypothetical protein
MFCTEAKLCFAVLSTVRLPPTTVCLPSSPERITRKQCENPARPPDIVADGVAGGQKEVPNMALNVRSWPKDDGILLQVMKIPTLRQKEKVNNRKGIDGVIYQCQIKDLDGNVQEFLAHGLDKVTGALGHANGYPAVEEVVPVCQVREGAEDVGWYDQCGLPHWPRKGQLAAREVCQVQR